MYRKEYFDPDIPVPYALITDAATDHNHDETYVKLIDYNQGIFSLAGVLESKANTDHNHDATYVKILDYNQEINVLTGAIGGKADTYHNHHPVYAKIVDAATDHNHDTVYTKISQYITHNHDTVYAKLVNFDNHNHDTLYAKLVDYVTHNHDLVYAKKADYDNHNHDSQYVKGVDYVNHNHDPVYAKISNAATDHNHDARYALDTHYHDDRYTQIGHTHDTQYYTKALGDGRYAFKTDIAGPSLDLTPYALIANAFTDHNHNTVYASLYHRHDDDYYTTTDSDFIYARKVDAAVDHNHDATYAPLLHYHDSRYAQLVHGHDTVYANINHNHDSQYANINHDHNNNYASIDHNHDSQYAVKTRPIHRWTSGSLGLGINSGLKNALVIYSNNTTGIFTLTQPLLIPTDGYDPDWYANYINVTAWDIEIFNNSPNNSDVEIHGPPTPFFRNDLTFVISHTLPFIVPSNRMVTIRQIQRVVTGTSQADLLQYVEYIMFLSA